MNFATFVVLATINRESWATTTENENDKFPPLPLNWLPQKKVIEEKDLKFTRQPRGINSVPLGRRK